MIVGAYLIAFLALIIAIVASMKANTIAGKFDEMPAPKQGQRGERGETGADGADGHVGATGQAGHDGSPGAPGKSAPTRLHK